MRDWAGTGPVRGTGPPLSRTRNVPGTTDVRNASCYSADLLMTTSQRGAIGRTNGQNNL